MYRRIPGESNLRFKSVKRQLYRLREKIYPKNPKSCQDFVEMMKDPKIFEQFGKTENKQHRFYLGSQIKRHFAFHIFLSKATIKMIEEKIPAGERKYLMDGTFSIVPRNMSQLLVISLEYENNVSFHLLYE